MLRFTILVLLVLRFGSVPAQSAEATQLLLNYEKLKQLEEILDNMYKGYKVLTDGYNRIKSIAEGNFNMHWDFLNRLYAVNPVVSKYKRVATIIEYQKVLIREYKQAFRRVKDDDNLTVDEMKYVVNVYDYLIKQSLRNLEELTLIITATRLRMSDDERLTAIDAIYLDMEDKLAFLRYFNNSTQLLLMQRQKQKEEMRRIRRLQGIYN